MDGSIIGSWKECGAMHRKQFGMAWLCVFAVLIAAVWGCRSGGSRGIVQERECTNRAQTASDRNHAFQTRSLLGKPLLAAPPSDDSAKLHEDLVRAQADLAAHPDDPVRIVWVGRRLGYLWRMQEAVEVYSEGIRRFPDFAALYRHRGHRFISLRKFDQAVKDLEKAAGLISGKPDEVESDGAPNVRNIPLTTTAFNVWYHLGVAEFFRGDYSRASIAFSQAMRFTRSLDDNIVAVTDWQYQTFRRLGRHEEAVALLGVVGREMDIVENGAYHRRVLMYKGLIEPEDLIPERSAAALDFATLAYGLGFHFLHSGQTPKANGLFAQVVEGPYWPAFGYIAAEVELAREAARTVPMPLGTPRGRPWAAGN